MSQSSIFNLQSSIHSVRDFYAFEQHVKTCRKHRGLDMVPAWYQVPAFYFSNPVAIIGDGDPVHAPQGSNALDYELELACVISTAARDLPADDSAMNCVAGFTIMNDWSARDIQRSRWRLVWGQAKARISPAARPAAGAVRRIERRLSRRSPASGNDGNGEWHGLFPRQRRQHVLTWPQLLAHASRDTELRPGDVLGSGTVGTGCILELTPEAVGGWLKPGDIVELTIERIGTLRNLVVEKSR